MTRFPAAPDELLAYPIPSDSEECGQLQVYLVNAVQVARGERNTTLVQRLLERHGDAQQRIDANVNREEYRRHARQRMLNAWNKASTTVLYPEQLKHLGEEAEEALRDPAVAGVERLQSLLLEAEVEAEAAPDYRTDMVAAANARAERLREAIKKVSRR